MTNVACSHCHLPYPASGAPFCCAACGELYDFADAVQAVALRPDLTQPGIWRFRRALRLPEEAPVISLGEGNTPLVWGQLHGRRVAFKCEYANPSGSFKDRGEAPLVSFLRSRGVQEAVEDSSGNAGASFAAYAARAGMKARVYVPESASGPKRRQIEAYGAQVVSVPGPRSNASEVVRQAAQGGLVYASHAYLPFNLPGYATLAYELVEQMGMAPGTLLLPAGQGGLLLGVLRGFASLQAAGVIDRLPQVVGVQARRCAPLWAAYNGEQMGQASEGETVAEGIRVSRPLRIDVILRTLREYGGLFLAVDEAQIVVGRDLLARQGLYVEATSAVVAAAAAQLGEQARDPIVAVLSGSGLKSGG